ncbi:hypothetical protein AGRA3207_007030 [Actinomadura graeca]|uniref:Uncharacterized protein n=1 Tax=Actinomadura graeca TaxID=2750812 RepID=A0ABX8R964_9ACTN|nr:hypothetical protein [Actinomadura graeca]QXJ25523.1 hypothetical protein AGRA3207_007030 [Actinomadura graeca]
MIIVGEQMLTLGARIAEIEALYTCVLDAAGTPARRRFLAELAEAGARLADEAAGHTGRAVAPLPGPAGPGGGARPPRPRPRARVRRRIARTQRTADWIIARTARRAG